MELGTSEKTSGSPTSKNHQTSSDSSDFFHVFPYENAYKIVGSEKIQGGWALKPLESLDFLQVSRVSWSTPCLRAPTSRPGRVSSGRRRRLGPAGGWRELWDPNRWWFKLVDWYRCLMGISWEYHGNLIFYYILLGYGEYNMYDCIITSNMYLLVLVLVLVLVLLLLLLLYCNIYIYIYMG